MISDKLAESHSYPDKIISSVPDPIYVKDRQHRWVLVNDAFCSLLGYSRDNLLGKTVYDFLPPKNADEAYQNDESVLV